MVNCILQELFYSGYIILNNVDCVEENSLSYSSKKEEPLMDNQTFQQLQAISVIRLQADGSTHCKGGLTFGHSKQENPHMYGIEKRDLMEFTLM